MDLRSPSPRGFSSTLLGLSFSRNSVNGARMGVVMASRENRVAQFVGRGAEQQDVAGFQAVRELAFCAAGQEQEKSEDQVEDSHHGCVGTKGKLFPSVTLKEFFCYLGCVVAHAGSFLSPRAGTHHATGLEA